MKSESSIFDITGDKDIPEYLKPDEMPIAPQPNISDLLYKIKEKVDREC
jgi:hypothetical protein